MPYCDYIFGNETEAATYAEHHGLSADTPIEEIAKHISKLDKINKSRPRTVVFTQVSINDEIPLGIIEFFRVLNKRLLQSETMFKYSQSPKLKN